MKKMTEFVHFKTDSPFLPPNPANQFLLTDQDNYFESFRGVENRAILEKFTSLIFEYCLFFFDKIKCNKKKQIYFKYIFERGFDTVTSVFIGTLLNTRNVELSLHHGQKSLYFYIEFIEQISDTQNSFLQLSSRDAVMFVYKRTIFEINRDMIKAPPNGVTFPQSSVVEAYATLLKRYAMLFITIASKISDLTTLFNANEFITHLRELANEIVKLPLNNPSTLRTLTETLRPIFNDETITLNVFWEKNKQIIEGF
jgi:hypothetical protein